MIADKKLLQSFLGKLNHARPFIQNLSRETSSLYQKTSSTRNIKFNHEDIAHVKRIKEKIKNLPDLSLPLDNNYLIIPTDALQIGWGAILLG